MIYRHLSQFILRRSPPDRPAVKRLVLVLPCCIGDVVMATATLKALRRAYPDIHITWAVGNWSKAAIEGHPAIDALLDTGSAALPVKSIAGFIGFVRMLRAGHYDLAVSLVRSPLMSLALALTGIPYRAGLDSAGRGFGYNIRAPIDPDTPRSEADIYLDVPRVLGLETSGCRTDIPVRLQALELVRTLIHRHHLVEQQFIVLNPTGGRNPGMVMDSKRYPPERFAELALRLAGKTNAQLVIIGGPGDEELCAHVWRLIRANLTHEERVHKFVDKLSFAEIGALASLALVYIGNDTGLTHLAAATGAKTVMILGPTDPKRYAPYADKAIALWKPAGVSQQGVASGAESAWDWVRDGISVDEAEAAIMTFIESSDAHDV
ncbi:MAG: glycosyltransferase family 9 protein [Anaerolineae bacterium]